VAMAESVVSVRMVLLRTGSLEDGPPKRIGKAPRKRGRELTMARRPGISHARPMPRLDLESSVSVSVRSFSRVVALAAVVLPFAAACTAETEPVQEEAASEDELVGGKPESRFRAAGHLVHGATAADAAKAKVSCGATLVARTWS
jgi:hypothetical protein